MSGQNNSWVCVHLAGLLALLSLLLGCGSSGNSVSESATSEVSIRFSDAPVENLEQVVITVDQIIFRRDGVNVTVERFTSDELGIENADTFQIDLLEVQGNDNRLVLDAVTLPIGDYEDLRLVILDDDLSQSYVIEADSSAQREIKVPSDQLKLGGFTVARNSAQTFVIEFGLRQAMTYNPGPMRYILKPRGIRIVRLEQAASISGSVDLDAIHLLEGCSGKPDSSVDNVAYLYSGHDLDIALLGDVFVREDDAEESEIDDSVAENIIAPQVATSIDGSTGEYLFSYLPPGDYSVAISCTAGDDDPVLFDDIAIPQPAGQVLEVSLGEGESIACDFPAADACALIE